MKQVIPLMSEETRNTDGATKQDCEINASKRLIPKLRKTRPQLGIILGGDELFSGQPIIEDTLAARMHYLIVAKHVHCQIKMPTFRALCAESSFDLNSR